MTNADWERIGEEWVRKEKANERHGRENRRKSMERTLVILVFLLKGLWETEAVSATGKVGGEVTIKCSHVNAFANVKYFCTGACENKDILITSRGVTKESNGKYSITDEGNIFYVTISDVTEEDSGTYWCGIDRVGLDTYNEVVVTVIKGDTKDPGNLQSQEDTNTSTKLVYIGAGLGVVVLALATALVIFFRHRNRSISALTGKDHNTVYSTPCIQKQDARRDMTTSPAYEDEETDGKVNSIVSPSPDTSRDHRENIYSNVAVSSGPQIEPDGLFYSTVSFNKHTDCSTIAPRTATATYSSLKYISTEKSTV